MRNFILFIALCIWSLNSFAGTCTNTTRTNYVTNQVLTSSALNADFNQLVAKTNSLDGGCVTDGTLELAAINSSEWSAPLNGIHQGCKVSYSNSNTLSIGKCIASVNGLFVKTTASNNVTWGCSGCSSETATTTYYIFIKTGSTGTTLNGLISTVAPNEDGYDNSGNKVIARFYNNASSDIDQYSIDQWNTNRFVPQQTGLITYVPTIGASTTPPTKGTNTIDAAVWYREGQYMIWKYTYKQTGAGSAGAGIYRIPLPSGLLIDSTWGTLSQSPGDSGFVGIGAIANTVTSGAQRILTAHVIAATTTYFQVALPNVDLLTMYSWTDVLLAYSNTSLYISLDARVKIEGWLP